MNLLELSWYWWLLIVWGYFIVGYVILLTVRDKDDDFYSDMLFVAIWPMAILSVIVLIPFALIRAAFRSDKDKE